MQELLGDGDDAIELLEKALVKMPRGAGVAKQLAQKYLKRGKVEVALKTLETALERQPTERSIHLAIANILFAESKDLNDQKATNHLAASFVTGDREHWGRFLRAGHAYAIGNYAEAERLFDELHKRAPDDFRPRLGREHKWLSNALEDRQGVVAKKLRIIHVHNTDCWPG